MKIEIINKPELSTGLTVVIDVFRAFTVEPYLFRNGVEKIIPVGDVESAYKYKEKYNDCILIGERRGIKLPGFDYGNSPSQIENVNFTGKVVIDTTSCGTQGIVKSINAKEIITGSLVNVHAIVKYLKQRHVKDVFLLALAKPGMQPFDEDLLCAKYIKNLLEGKSVNDVYKKIEELKYTTGAKFFDKLKQRDFPQKDSYLCTEINKFNFILRTRIDEGGNLCIEKADV